MRNGNRPNRKMGLVKPALEIPNVLSSITTPSPKPDVYTPVQELRAEVLKSSKQTRERKNQK